MPRGKAPPKKAAAAGLDPGDGDAELARMMASYSIKVDESELDDELTALMADDSIIVPGTGVLPAQASSAKVPPVQTAAPRPTPTQADAEGGMETAAITAAVAAAKRDPVAAALAAAAASSALLASSSEGEMSDLSEAEAEAEAESEAVPAVTRDVMDVAPSADDKPVDMLVSNGASAVPSTAAVGSTQQEKMAAVQRRKEAYKAAYLTAKAAGDMSRCTSLTLADMRKLDASASNCTIASDPAYFCHYARRHRL